MTPLRLAAGTHFVVTGHRQGLPDLPYFLHLPLGSPHHGRGIPERWRGKSGDGVRADRVLWADESAGRIGALPDDLRIAGPTD